MKVKFTSKYENKENGLKAYEFETPDFIEIVVDEYYLHIFRLDCVKGEWRILEMDYDFKFSSELSRDFTHFFDLDDIIKQMQEIENEIPCQQKEYEEWLEEGEDEYSGIKNDKVEMRKVYRSEWENLVSEAIQKKDIKEISFLWSKLDEVENNGYFTLPF